MYIPVYRCCKHSSHFYIAPLHNEDVSTCARGLRLKLKESHSMSFSRIPAADPSASTDVCVITRTLNSLLLLEQI